MNESQTAWLGSRFHRRGAAAELPVTARFSAGFASLRFSGRGSVRRRARIESARRVGRALSEGWSAAGLGEVGWSLEKMGVTMPNQALEPTAAPPLARDGGWTFRSLCCRLSQCWAAVAQLGRSVVVSRV